MSKFNGTMVTLASVDKGDYIAKVDKYVNEKGESNKPKVYVYPTYTKDNERHLKASCVTIELDKVDSMLELINEVIAEYVKVKAKAEKDAKAKAKAKKDAAKVDKAESEKAKATTSMVEVLNEQLKKGAIDLDTYLNEMSKLAR